VSDGEVNLALDRKPYTSLLYGNGVGYQGAIRSIFEPHTRKNLTSFDTGIGSLIRTLLVKCRLIKQRNTRKSTSAFLQCPISKYIIRRSVPQELENAGDAVTSHEKTFLDKID